VEEDESLKTGAGSVFQGLRADLEGYVDDFRTPRHCANLSLVTALRGCSLYVLLALDLMVHAVLNLSMKGHATGQTTGLGGHLAARFIPTVERESIDLV
jgi:hypothetical protein